MRIVEINWELIDKWINVHLKVQGIDPTKEMRTWAKFGPNDSMILVFAQEDNPGPCNTPKTQIMHNPPPRPIVDVPVTTRPSYLQRKDV